MDGDPHAIARMYERHAHFLQIECNTLREELSRQDVDIAALRSENGKLRKENALLKRRVEELTRIAARKSKDAPAKPPPFVKPAVPDGKRKKPGRRRGHRPDLRPRPRKADIHKHVSLSVDRDGKLCCPECATALNEVKHHRRWVEDIIPAKVVTTCYHTHSGYCPCCRKRIESRAPEQPPPADLPHAQLGLEALATVAMMRVCYRLPLRQISQLFADLPGLKLCPGAISKQIVRLGRWLSGQYDRLQLVLRAAGVVYADETGWRINGKNGHLWTLTNKTHTLYHADRSRSGEVIAGLLGEAFGGTLVSDFYAVYDPFECPQQKCLAHLLRDLREAVQQRPELGKHAFFTRCKRLLQWMLRLKKQR